MDIFEKELAIAEATYEATVNRNVSIDAIESMYMTEASEDSNGFFKRMIQAIKDFFKKIKEAISKKLADMKAKQAIEKIKKEGIKEINGVKTYNEFDKLFKSTEKKVVEAFTRHIKNINSAKDENDIKKSYEAFVKEEDEIIKEYDSSCDKIANSKNVASDIAKYQGVSCDEIESTAAWCLHKLDEFGNKLAKEKSSKEGYNANSNGELKKIKEEGNESSIINAKQSAIKKAGTKVTSSLQKLGKAISQHKIATFTAVCATITVGAHASNRTLHKKTKKMMDSIGKDMKDSKRFHKKVEKMREENEEYKKKIRKDEEESYKNLEKMREEHEGILNDYYKIHKKAISGIKTESVTVDDLLEELENY